MKTHLARFYNSLACRVAWAIVATATVANAHDLPQHFQHAPTDWGMLQQDCLGHHDRDQFTIDSVAFSKTQLVEIAVALPDAGNPPEPQVMSCSDRDPSADHCGPALYDGVDCAHLESFYRTTPADQWLELTQDSVPEPAVTLATTADCECWEFHKSFYAACSCEFENRQANQSIVPARFILKRTYIEDHFATELNNLKPLVLRELSASPDEQLAIAIPAQPVQNKHVLADALSQLVNWDCIARSEFCSSQRAFQFGEFAGFLTKTWFSDTLPRAAHAIADFAQKLKPAQQSVTSAPQFVIYTTAAGNELAIPIAQARNWQQPAIDAPLTEQAIVSPELQELVESAKLQLQWAGGKLSDAASFMNDWFSNRLARAKSNDLR